MKTSTLLFFFLIILTALESQGQNEPLKVGIAGLSHTHVHWIFNSEKRGEIKIVGIAEPNKELAARYAKQYDFPINQIFENIEALIKATQPEAVTAFGPIYQHLEIVEACAPKGIHVMVEKPLAVNLAHAQKMRALAQQYNIHLLTNYETTWYPTNHRAYEIVKKGSTIGEIRKIIVRDGHKGPKKIGVDKEFLAWLTDPVENGGGAITDFGCYGANLLTWLMEGERPNSVTAITQQLQAENNPKVDDEAIILVQYDKATAIIQASWNWPIGRKDMEIYGLKGVVYADNRHDLRVRISEGYDGFTEEVFKLEERQAPYDDPFALLAAVIKNDIELPAFDLNSLENNMIAMEILDAAVQSAKLGQTIILKK